MGVGGPMCDRVRLELFGSVGSVGSVGFVGFGVCGFDGL